MVLLTRKYSFRYVWCRQGYFNTACALINRGVALWRIFAFDRKAGEVF